MGEVDPSVNYDTSRTKAPQAVQGIWEVKYLPGSGKHAHSHFEKKVVYQ